MSGQPEFEMTGGFSRTDNDLCIVSCGIGPHYQEGLHSTRLHCEVNVPEAWRLFYRELPLGCPPHDQQMYAFKIWAMQRAIDAGFRYVLWMDSGFQPIYAIDPLVQVIKSEGWYVPRQGAFMLDEWCSDDMMVKLSILAKDLQRIPLCFSGLVGLDMKSEIGNAIWWKWKRTQEEGAWNGAHYNRPGEPMTPFGLKTQGHVSNLETVKGHRHDEAALSWVLWSLGLTPMSKDFLTLESERGFIGRHVKLVTPGGLARMFNDVIPKASHAD
jgi:hypothetical protein